ncbi:MAG: hypothetical protein L0312_07040, partial [Acidobacteria bacterium]|nr:hypothetical protein [Acidobacteriota bacterium]
MRLFTRKGLMVVAGVVAFLVVAGLAFVSLAESASSAILKKTLWNANAGNYSAANQELSADVRVGLGSGITAHAIWDDITRKGTIERIEILREETRGEGATIQFKLHYKDGSVFEAQEKMIKEDGNWKLSMLNILNKRMQVSLEGLEDDSRPPGNAATPEKNRKPLVKGKDTKPSKSGKDRVTSLDSKPSAQKPFDATRIDSFLGISSDFMVCAVSDASGIRIVDRE